MDSRKRPFHGVRILDEDEYWDKEEIEASERRVEIGISGDKADEILRWQSKALSSQSNWREEEAVIRAGTSDDDDEIIVPRRPCTLINSSVTDEEALVSRRPAQPINTNVQNRLLPSGTAANKQIEEGSDSDLEPPRRPSTAALDGTADDSDAEVPRRPIVPLNSRKNAIGGKLASMDPPTAALGGGLVYRDSLGRKIDVEAEEALRNGAQASRAALLAKQSQNWNMGAVQKAERSAAMQALEASALSSLTRTLDDVNKDVTLRSRAREGDPMASANSGGGHNMERGVARLSATGKPLYAGPPAPPNRYYIAPGYRWDGVDRGTGWESKRATFIADKLSKGGS